MAQFRSEKNWLEANVVRGCFPLTVNLTHTGVNGTQLQIDFLGDPNDPLSNSFVDNTPPASVFLNPGESASFTYDQANLYLIRAIDLSGTGSREDRFDLLDVEIFDQVQPAVSVAACANNTVVLTFDTAADPFDSYEIDFMDGTQMTATPTENDPTVQYTYSASGNFNITVSGLFNDGNASNCSVSNLGVQTVFRIPRPILNAITVLSETSILFEYDQLDPTLTYQLQIDDGSGFRDHSTIDPSTDANSLIIEDNTIDANNLSYVFRIVATDFCEVLEEESESASSIGLRSSFVEITNSLRLRFDWVISSNGFMEAYLLNNQALLETTSLASSHRIYDFATCTEIGTFFMESTINGIVSRSINLMPFENEIIDLPAPNSPNVVLQGNRISIRFEPTDFPLDEIQISRKTASVSSELIGTVSNSNAPFTDTSVPQGITEACYSITYTDQCGNFSLRSEETCIELAGNLIFPNAFSPNGDPINNTFGPGPGVFNNYRLIILNRWGDVVFQSYNPTDSWDGKVSGQLAPAGTYIYKSSYTNTDNVTITRNGTVTLMR